MKKVLCAIDFSHFAPMVLDCAQEMIRGLQGELTVFHTVHFPQDGLYNTDAVVERPAKTERLREQAVVAMDRLMASASVAWQGRVAVGAPVDQILEAVRRWDMDLVVAASHGLSGVQRLLLGTVVENLARRLDIPLMVVCPRHGRENDASPISTWSPKSILVGCQLHPRDEPAVAVSLTLARAFQARIQLIHAMAAPPDTETAAPLEGPFIDAQERLMGRWHQRLAAQLPQDAEAGIRLVPGAPGEALVDGITDPESALIIVGAQPRSVLGKLLMGSTTEWVLRHAPCPVLVVPTADPATGLTPHG